jgi:hypothetical protein
MKKPHFISFFVAPPSPLLSYFAFPSLAGANDAPGPFAHGIVLVTFVFWQKWQNVNYEPDTKGDITRVVSVISGDKETEKFSHGERQFC